MATKIPLSELSRAEIKHAITSDFLSFTLNYTLDTEYFDFTLNNGTHVSLEADGVITFNSATYDKHTLDKETKNIVLSSGIHGNETAPIEICNKLIKKLLSEEVETCHRVMFIYGNIEAIESGTRFVEENMNRLFSQTHVFSSKDGKRADLLMQKVDDFFRHVRGEKFHYDLHTAIRASKYEKFAVRPFNEDKPYNKTQLSFLAECGVNTVLLSSSPSFTFSYFSSFYHKAESFTVELGKVQPFGKNDMSKFKAIKQKLIELICDHQISLPDFEDCRLNIFKVKQTIIKQSEDFVLHFDEQTPNFTPFNKGDVLASQSGIEHCALQDKEAVVFPNANVEIGHRAMLTVVPVII